MVVKKVAESKQFDAVIAIGVLIRGATSHFDHIAAEATKGVAQAALDSGVPVTYGVLTTDTIEQAIERAGTKAGNKGWEAAAAAIEMANLYKHLNF
jgi:6,7-dimethyl-8-ribityllumazine synthase